MTASNNEPNAPFMPGDTVVYPGHGVGKVTSIETQRVADQDIKLFVISFEHARMTLRIPFHKTKASGLRGISTRRVMNGALEVLKGPSRQRRGVWSRQALEYAAKIKSGDPLLIAEVVRDLRPTVEKPVGSYSQQEFYEQALTRLVHEFAAVDQIQIEDASRKLQHLLQAA